VPEEKRRTFAFFQPLTPEQVKLVEAMVKALPRTPTVRERDRQPGSVHGCDPKLPHFSFNLVEPICNGEEAERRDIARDATSRAKDKMSYEFDKLEREKDDVGRATRGSGSSRPRKGLSCGPILPCIFVS